TNNPKFPNNPDVTAFLTTPNWSQTPNSVWTAGNEENYALRMKGWFVPTIAGNYTFNVHADDSGMLRVSTDSNPDNLRTILFAPGDCGACGNPASSVVTLAAGQMYYYEALFQEGGGGDYLELRWTPPAGVSQFIPGDNLRYCIDPQKVGFTI